MGFWPIVASFLLNRLSAVSITRNIHCLAHYEPPTVKISETQTNTNSYRRPHARLIRFAEVMLEFTDGKIV